MGNFGVQARGNSAGTMPSRSARSCCGWTPGEVPTARARTAHLYHGGGETNVAEGLSYCFGLRTAVVTALVDDGVGRNIENQLREAGVDHEPGDSGSTQGQGAVQHGPEGFAAQWDSLHVGGQGGAPVGEPSYYRAHTPIRALKPGDYDWGALFAQGVRWFNTGGIYALLSPSTGPMAVEALQAAGAAGTFRSFDLNYRSKVEPDKEHARKQNRESRRTWDFLVGNQSDFDDSLGETCRKVGKRRTARGLAGGVLRVAAARGQDLSESPVDRHANCAPR